MKYYFILIILFLVSCTSQMDSQMMDEMMADGPMMKHEPPFELGKDIQPDKEQPTKILELQDGDTVDLTASIIEKNIQGKTFKMYAYNGQIPGPIFKVKKGTTITVNFHNKIDQDTTVHWHGLRHDNKDDGVPDLTQPTVLPEQSHTYTVKFPDQGVFWYHPHVREDLQQDAGLYGNMIVGEFNNNVNREEIIVLDDILMQNENLVPWGKDYATHALMGRFGNVMLINGETDYTTSIWTGEVVRFYITNVANARPFNLKIPNAKIKLVGGDIGKFEKETFIDELIIAPAERYIIEVYFEKSGHYELLNDNPVSKTKLGTIMVADGNSLEDYSEEFLILKENKEVVQDINNFKQYFDKPVDYEIDLTLEMDMMMPGMDNDEGMMMDDDHMLESKIEWEDDMGMMNLMSTSENTKWILKDKKSGKKNMDFKLKAKVGDKLKIRLFNDPKSVHPMQHPIHLHGQRFLVLNTDGKQNTNMVWKDTVLVPTGETVDILVDVTNPGEWMMHCHIAEHLTAGMMTSLIVEE